MQAAINQSRSTILPCVTESSLQASPSRWRRNWRSPGHWMLWVCRNSRSAFRPWAKRSVIDPGSGAGRQTGSVDGLVPHAKPGHRPVPGLRGATGSISRSRYRISRSRRSLAVPGRGCWSRSARASPRPRNWGWRSVSVARMPHAPIPNFSGVWSSRRSWRAQGVFVLPTPWASWSPSWSMSASVICAPCRPGNRDARP